MLFEAQIIRFLQLNTGIGFISFFQAITLLGGIIGAFITFIILFFSDRKLSIVFIIAFILASIINYILKITIARSRPFEIYPDIINYGNEDGYSMPSGHSMSAGLFVTFLFYINIKSTSSKITKSLCGIFLILILGTIMLSRLVLGVHFLTDTIVGMIEGILLAIIAILLYNYYKKKGNKNSI